MPNWGQILNTIREIQQPQVSAPHDALRRDYLTKLEEYTGRDVILYSSGWTHINTSEPQFSITDADLHGLMEVIYGLDGPEVDIILHSPGGTPTAAESLVDYLHSKFDDVRIIVPHAAMSAGTMMCCAADEVVMGRHSFLGPIDPQISLNTPTGYRSVPAQAILQQFEQAQEEIEEDNDNLAHWSPILRQYGPSLIVECEQAVNLSQELAETWAEDHLFSGSPDAHTKAKQLAEKLSDFDTFKNHGRHINRERAREYGFEITDLEDDQELQDLVLSVYHTATLTHVQTEASKIIENQNGNAFIHSSNNDQQGENQPSGTVFPSMDMPPQGPPQRPSPDEE